MPRPVRSIVSSILLLALGATCKSHAEEPGEKIIAAMPRHFPPIYSVSRNNLPTGFGVQFMELVAKYADLDVEYHPEPTWAQTLESLRTNRADLIPNLGITPERQREFVFSKPYDHVELSIFVRRDNMRVHGRDDLRAAHVGVVQANFAQTLLRQEDGININVYGSLGQLVAALEQQEVDAAVYPANIFSDFTAKLGIRDSVKKSVNHWRLLRGPSRCVRTERNSCQDSIGPSTAPSSRRNSRLSTSDGIPALLRSGTQAASACS